MLPKLAYRDEGTSYHYAQASDTIEVNKGTYEALSTFFKEKGITFHTTKVWTTDGFYREMKDKVYNMRKNGFSCVDMECSALGALATFRDKRIAQFFYSADTLAEETWDKRSLSNHNLIEEKQGIVELALEFALHYVE